MFVPEPVRRDLTVSAALYGGLFLGELTAALVRAFRERGKPEPVVTVAHVPPTPEVSDDSVVPQ